MAQLNGAARRASEAAAAARAKKREGAREEALDFGPLAHWVGFALRMAQTATFQAFARETEGLDMRPGRFAVLTLIGHNPGISQTALSRANGRDKSTLTPALNDLKRRGLITRTRPKSDRRSYQLTLTAAGEAMLARLTQGAERHEQNLDRVIGARDRARFLRILRKLRDQL